MVTVDGYRCALVLQVRKTEGRCAMKHLFVAVCAVVCLTIGCTSGSKNEYYSYDYLKNDFDQVAIVASVTVQDVAAVDSMGPSTSGAGYVRYRIRCRVIEPFKGEAKAG